MAGTPTGPSLRAVDDTDAVRTSELPALLVVLVLLLVGTPLSTLGPVAASAFSLAYVALLFVGTRLTVGRFGGRLGTALGIATGVVLVPWALVDLLWLEVLGYVMLVAFQVLLIAALVDHLFHQRTVGVSGLLAGASTYLLLGNAFTPVHMLVDIATRTATGVSAYSWPEGVAETWQTMVYFSFATLTTLGFGDVTPATEVAQSATILETVVGQIFLAVLIGRLVSLHTSGTAATGEGAS